jgi:glycosyltransferase involved in cell wall biosynthesis
VKLLVFAHTPPPFHGQSFMVKLMLDSLGGDHRGKARGSNETIECFHVNARFSSDLANIGSFSVQKIFRLIQYCAEAIWCRFRYGADVFYYIPAPPKRFAFYRDCFVLLLCRPFFRHVVFHWQASGLGKWLQGNARSWERWIARLLLSSPDLSMTLAKSLSNDATYFRSKRTCVTPNGIVDPCPDFEESVRPYREARLGRRREMLDRKSVPPDNREKYLVVFLAHCTREKGLFDTLHAIALANQQLEAQTIPLRMHLTVAGAFLSEAERQEFESWRAAHRDDVDYAGFLGAEAKAKLLRQSDCLCFPTFYSAEAQPVSIIEAMAFGLAIVTSAWRGIPELLPEKYPFSISKHDPPLLAQALMESMRTELGFDLRRHYGNAFTEKRYMENLRQALRIVRGPSAQ